VASGASAGSAERHGRLWGARAEAWADEEDLEAPKYALAIERVGVAPGQAVLDVGCGSGVFLRLVADRGARPYGLDASGALIEIARRRVPEADLRVGDMQRLPYGDDAFDLVAGFNVFFFADDMTAALAEAGRVARPGAPVLIQVWGRPERCDLTPMLRAVRALRPAAGAPAGAPLSQPGALEAIAAEAGLVPESAFDVAVDVDYPDEHALLRSMLAPGGVIEAIEAHGERAVADAILEALGPCRTAAGGYRLENEWRTLVARAPGGSGQARARNMKRESAKK
jgi:SAM-dependent methyltransferase